MGVRWVHTMYPHILMGGLRFVMDELFPPWLGVWAKWAPMGTGRTMYERGIKFQVVYAPRIFLQEIQIRRFGFWDFHGTVRPSLQVRRDAADGETLFFGRPGVPNTPPPFQPCRHVGIRVNHVHES